MVAQGILGEEQSGSLAWLGGGLIVLAGIMSASAQASGGVEGVGIAQGGGNETRKA